MCSGWVNSSFSTCSIRCVTLVTKRVISRECGNDQIVTYDNRTISLAIRDTYIL